MQSVNSKHVLLFSVGVSIFGLCLALLLAFNPPPIHENLSWRKPLVGSVFGAVCVLGILAALFPKQCSHSFHSETKNSRFTANRIGLGSHHPDCQTFSAHIIRMNNHALCAACTGLLLGALIAIIGTALYFFGRLTFLNFGLPMVLIGIIGVALGFFQLKFRGVIRSVLNLVFVLAALMVLVGIDSLVESLLTDLLVLAFIVFWIFTRILLSQWDHWKICANCESQCEVTV
ncbi:MAG TPA: hypothetical protein VIH48_01265 [Candidatus Bathyarchaeia archaeon]